MPEHWEHAEGKTPRAPRFPVALAIRYRSENEIAWHIGRSENISRSGVLFRGDHPVELLTPVEMIVLLPATAGRPHGARVLCHGYVVRTVTMPSAEVAVEIGTTIADFEFAPPSAINGNIDSSPSR